MLLLIACVFQLFYQSMSAGLDDLQPLNRTNLLHIMRNAEKKRYSEEIVRDIYTSVVEEATNGKSEFAIEFTGCDNSNVKISEELCVEIVNDVFVNVQAKFPDGCR